jgi:hypothetical protein
MKLATRIAPFGEQPGLVAYECPACGAVRSVLVPASERGSNRDQLGS